MLKTERMDRVRAALRAQGLTQMIVCDPKSVWYLTGVAVEPYERLLALYLPTEGEPVLFLNRLFNVPEPPCRTVWHTDTDKPVAQIAEVVDAGRPLGIDKEWPAKFLIPLMETHPGMQVVLVHGEEKAQQILSGLIKDQFHLSVYAPGYLEEMALAAGATPEVVVTAQPKSYAHVDWDLLLEETEGKLSKLRTRLEKAGERPWDEQVDIRDRILELNKELLSVLTQL